MRQVLLILSISLRVELRTNSASWPDSARFHLIYIAEFIRGLAAIWAGLFPCLWLGRQLAQPALGGQVVLGRAQLVRPQAQQDVKLPTAWALWFGESASRSMEAVRMQKAFNF